MFHAALMPVNDTDQMLAHVFAGRNASDLVCGVGQKSLELGTVLALTSQVRRTSPIGRWHRMLDGGRFELLADGDQPGHQLWRNQAELLPRPRYQRFQAGNLAIVQAEFVRRFLDEVNHVRQVFVTTACRKRLEQQRERPFGNGSFPAQAGESYVGRGERGSQKRSTASAHNSWASADLSESALLS